MRASMKSEYLIRRATLEDLDELVRLRMVMQTDGESIDDSGRRQLEEATRRYFRDKLGTEELVALLAEAGGRAIGSGVLVLFRKPPRLSNLEGWEGYILSMYTEPEWRRRGIATAIVRELVDAAKAVGAALVFLRASDMGRPVYAKEGFAESPHYMQLWIGES